VIVCDYLEFFRCIGKVRRVRVCVLRCNLLILCWRFGTTYRSHLQGFSSKVVFVCPHYKALPVCKRQISMEPLFKTHRSCWCLLTVWEGDVEFGLHQKLPSIQVRSLSVHSGVALRAKFLMRVTHMLMYFRQKRVLWTDHNCCFFKEDELTLNGISKFGICYGDLVWFVNRGSIFMTIVRQHGVTFEILSSSACTQPKRNTL
jgi:hypothetical protein